jgi:hypothetical protein
MRRLSLFLAVLGLSIGLGHSTSQAQGMPLEADCAGRYAFVVGSEPPSPVTHGGTQGVGSPPQAVRRAKPSAASKGQRLAFVPAALPSRQDGIGFLAVHPGNPARSPIRLINAKADTRH